MKPPYYTADEGESFTFDHFLTKLRNREPFVFLRYGDGEMKCILEPGQGANCDGHEYFPRLGIALSRVLDEQNEKQTYYIGLQNLGKRRFPEFINQWPNIQWSNADILHHASGKGRIGELFEAMNRVPCTFIGPNHLFKVAKGIDTIITIPESNCWNKYDEIHKQVSNILFYRKGIGMYFFSCSMMAEPLINDLAKEFPEATLIDAGSLWDPYCGVSSRGYHKEVIEREVSRKDAETQ